MRLELRRLGDGDALLRGDAARRETRDQLVFDARVQRRPPLVQFVHSTRDAQREKLATFSYPELA